jgi:uncharacterized protein with NAD-binding domain and iron-sulfur cluster
MHTVAILGGGVGGLSAAHELSTRGFDVHVYEMRDAFGGKARSIDVPDPPTGERKPLPGEHGFRFFPGFYQHIILTMQDIPSGSGKTVKDHLVRATRILIAQAGKRNELVDTTEFPSTIPDLAVLAQFIWDYALAVRVSPIDVAYFLQRMLTLLLSCDERRKQQWDLLSWWDFIGAEERSEKYRKFLADGMTRTLVAAQAKLMSARTGGLIAWQIVFDMARVGNRADQVLDGPTSEVWIKPWVDYLQTAPRDVKFHKNREVTEIHCRNGVITEVTVTEVEHTGTRTERTGKTETVKADYYVAAMPVERLDPLVTPEMRAADPQLTKLKRLITRWMNGVIFYLDQNVRLERGHVLFVDSEWALTAISQAQFWPDVDLSKYGDGKVQGVLSVDVSDWYSPGHRTGKCAMECNRDEIFTEVWGQILDAIDDGSLDAVNVLYQFIDPAIEFPNPSEVTNAEPLLINTAGSWTDRPDAVTKIRNLFLAADFVQTNTDLATMEAANEAARRAVNGILKASGSNEPPCYIFEMYEPGVVAQLRAFDRIRWYAERGIGRVFKSAETAAVDVARAMPRLFTLAGYSPSDD